MTTFNGLVLIVLFPLIGAVYNGLFGAKLQRRYGEKAVHFVAVLLPWGSFIVTLIAMGYLIALDPPSDRALHQALWKWVAVGNLDVDLAFFMDPLSAIMTLIVTFVGSLIHVYSMGYMKSDPAYWRYFSYLNLFMFSMLVLVLGDNFLIMFIGWEGVGLCSYLLIAFWYQKRSYAAAGMKAFVVNRLGDWGFTIGLFALFWGLLGVAGATSLRFLEVEALVAQPEVANQLVLYGLPTIICILLFVGATGKSAQIPLYTWLPDAMAGPTPVSALIHAATMVTAGVYMVARLHFLFALTPTTMTIIATIGAITAIFAATIGLLQTDIKKVLAYSTVSQLGFMFMAVGVGAWWVAIFHLMTHAFFKACLFLGSGSVILGCHHNQDMRYMGGLKKLMPITAMTYFLSCCAIAGFPFFSGFFSKDEILWNTFRSGTTLIPGPLLWAIGALAALCTSFYMFRSYYMTFSGEYRGSENPAAHANDGHDGQHHGLPHESGRSITWVLIILGALAVVGGWVGPPHIWHIPNPFEHWLAPVFTSSADRIVWASYGAGVEWGLMILSIGIAFGGWGLARWLYKDNTNPLPKRLMNEGSPLVRRLHRLVFNKYYVDEIYQVALVDRSLDTGRGLSWFDGRILDGLVNFFGLIARFFARIGGAIDTYFVDGLVNAIARMTLRGGRDFNEIQTGRLQTYLYGIVAGVALLVGVVFLVG